MKKLNNSETRYRETTGKVITDSFFFTGHVRSSATLQTASDLDVPSLTMVEKPVPPKRKPLTVVPTGRFYLVNDSYHYLHFSGKGTTTNKSFAFWGVGTQLSAMLRAHPGFRRIPYDG